MDIKLTYNITEWPQWGLNYIGIPKCGNTMMKWYLLGQPSVNNLEEANAELHKINVAKYITPEQANKNSYKCFALIRHPYLRVIAMYEDFCHKRDGLLGNKKNQTIDEFIDQVVMQSDDTINSNIHLRSNMYFLKDIINVTLFDLDSLDQTGQQLKDIFQIEEFARLHTTDMTLQLTDEQKEKIKIRYAVDFEKLY